MDCGCAIGAEDAPAEETGTSDAVEDGPAEAVGCGTAADAPRTEIALSGTDEAASEDPATVEDAAGEAAPPATADCGEACAAETGAETVEVAEVGAGTPAEAPKADATPSGTDEAVSGIEGPAAEDDVGEAADCCIPVSEDCGEDIPDEADGTVAAPKAADTSSGTDTGTSGDPATEETALGEAVDCSGPTAEEDTAEAALPLEEDCGEACAALEDAPNAEATPSGIFASVSDAPATAEDAVGETVSPVTEDCCEACEVEDGETAEDTPKAEATPSGTDEAPSDTEDSVMA